MNQDLLQKTFTVEPSTPQLFPAELKEKDTYPERLQAHFPHIEPKTIYGFYRKMKKIKGQAHMERVLHKMEKDRDTIWEHYTQLTHHGV